VLMFRRARRSADSQTRGKNSAAQQYNESLRDLLLANSAIAGAID
jgi:hypothetical protein